MTGSFVCFLDSYFLFFLFGLSNCLRIHGYLIKYPWIFHYVSTVTRSFCFALAVNCLHGVGFSHNAVFVFTHTNLTDLTKSSSIVFCFTRNGVRRPKGPKAISRKTRRFLSSLDFWSHTDLTNLTKAYIACARMYHPAESTRQSRQARAKRRAICEIREICVRQIHRTWFFAFFARFA